MKHLTTFASKEAYESVKTKLAKPNVSLAGDEIIYLPVEPGPTSEMVDLGLPSKTLWCKHNLGADAPEDDGLYYAWGDTEGFSTQQISENMFSYYWYSTRPGASVEEDLSDNTDAAHVALGSGYATPTIDEIGELFSFCNLEKVQISGKTCAKFTSKINGNSIIIPMAGYGHDGSVRNRTEARLMLSNYEHQNACYMGLIDSYEDDPFLLDILEGENRYYGYTVRPVFKK